MSHYTASGLPADAQDEVLTRGTEVERGSTLNFGGGVTREVPSTHIAFFKSGFDNIVETKLEPWSEVCVAFSHHRVTADKNDLGFITGRFLPAGPGTREADVPGTNGDTQFPGTVGRYGENLAAMDCWCLDFDNDEPLLAADGRPEKDAQGNTIKVPVRVPVTPEQLRAQLQGIRHLGYSSYNHGKTASYSDELRARNPRAQEAHGQQFVKFRVVIHLRRPIPVPELLRRQDGLRAMFPGVDPRSFDRARIFYAPSTPGGREVLAWHETGAGFDWVQVSTTPEREPSYEAAPIILGDQERDELLHMLAKCHFNDRDDWWRLGAALFGAGYALYDYKTLSDGDAKTQKICEQNWEAHTKWSGRRLGIGYLRRRVQQEFPAWQAASELTDELLLVRRAQEAAEPEEPEADEPPKARPKTEFKGPPPRKFDDLLSDAHRVRVIKEFLVSAQRADRGHFVLETAEGWWKTSSVVKHLSDALIDTLLVCASNKQATEKCREFAQYGAVRIWSLRGLVEDRFGVKPESVKNDQKGAFEGEDIDEEGTIAKLLELGLVPSLEAGLQALEDLRDEARISKKTSSRLAVTTFATGNQLWNQSFGRIRRDGGDGRVIVVDDPSIGDLELIKYRDHPMSDAEQEVTKERARLLKRREFSQLTAAEEMRLFELGVACLKIPARDLWGVRGVAETPFGQEFRGQASVLWLTTEGYITVPLLQAFHPGIKITQITEALKTEGRVLILPTKLVKKRLKSILPGIWGATERETQQLHLLAGNGFKEPKKTKIALDWSRVVNLVSSKGRNDLNEDMTVAISKCHPCAVWGVAATFHFHQEIEAYLEDIAALRCPECSGLNELNAIKAEELRAELEKKISEYNIDRVHYERVELGIELDLLNQIVGRNQGYRAKGKFSLLLCDPRLYNAIIAGSRYELLSLDGLQRRARMKGCPVEWSVAFPDYWATWLAYLTTWHRFVELNTANNKVTETFSGQRLNLTPALEAEVQERLTTPTEFVSEIWRVLDKKRASAEPFTSQEMHALIQVINERPETAPTTKGTKLYHNPAEPRRTAQKHVPGTEPAGWVLVETKAMKRAAQRALKAATGKQKYWNPTRPEQKPRFFVTPPPNWVLDERA